MSLRERKFILFFIDLILVNVVLLISLVLRGDTHLEWPTIWERGYWFAILGGVWLLFATVFGLYDLNIASANIRNHMFKVLLATLSVSTSYYLIPVLTPELPERRLAIYYFPLLMMTVLLIWRMLFFQLSRNQLFISRVLLVGAGASRQELNHLCEELDLLQAQHHAGGGYRILGLVDDQFDEAEKPSGIPYLGKVGELDQLLSDQQPREIVVVNGSSAEPAPDTVQHLISCREKGYTITRLVDFYENLTQRVPGDQLGNQFVQMLPQEQSGARRLYRLSHRGFDLVISTIGCLMTLFMIPVIWAVNRFVSPGPMFYSQERVGLAAKPYRIYKFRSMIVNAEKETGAVWAKENDTRVTKFGRFLRRSRLDEFPQFWNVLKGEMSIIGPRPERPEFVADLANHLPFYRLRHAVKPGITGWAQIKYPYGASLLDAKIKLQYDLFYIKHQNLFLDLMITLRTISVVLGLRGR